jgi:hypothetical protein
MRAPRLRENLLDAFLGYEGIDRQRPWMQELVCSAARVSRIDDVHYHLRRIIEASQLELFSPLR